MIRQILNRITLEPLIFLFTFGSVILDGAQIQTNLLLWKICHLELNYTEDICSNLTLDENNATMIEVQERANSFLMISEWLSAAPAFIWCLFSGKIQRYTYRVLQTIQRKLILLCDWAERAVLGSAETALKFNYEI